MIKYWNINEKYPLNLELIYYIWRKLLIHAVYHTIVTRKKQTISSQFGRHTMIRWQNKQPSLVRKVWSLSFVARLITRKSDQRIPRSPIDSFPDLCTRLYLSSLGSPDTRSWASTVIEKKWLAVDKNILWTRKKLENKPCYMKSTLLDHTLQPPLVR